MDDTLGIKDLTSFQWSSPLELDRKFFGEQSLPSGLSLDQPSSWKLTDYSDSRGSASASPCLLSNPTSPCQGPSCGFVAPLPKKFSTPSVLLQKPKTDSCLDQSYADLTANMSWDVSLIKAENSPRVVVESSSNGPMRSANPQSHQGAEV